MRYRASERVVADRNKTTDALAIKGPSVSHSSSRPHHAHCGGGKRPESRGSWSVRRGRPKRIATVGVKLLNLSPTDIQPSKYVPHSIMPTRPRDSPTGRRTRALARCE